MNPTSSTSLTQTDATNVVDNFISSADANKKTRTSQFEKYEIFVGGDQWDTDQLPDGDDPALTFNKSEDYINTYLAKLFPKNPETGALEIGVKCQETDEKKKEAYEKEILDNYEKNNLPSILMEQGKNYLVGGDACLYFPKDPLTNSAKIISIDPTTVYLGWNGDKLEQFAFEDQINLAEAEKNSKDNWLIGAIKTFLNIGNQPLDRFKKVKRITYWDEDFQIIKIDKTCEVRENTDHQIPVAWIPNNPVPHKHEGRSEIKSLYSLEQEINYRTSDFGKRVKENTDAVLAISSDLDSSKVTRESVRDGILAMAKGDKAEFLKLDENKEVLEYTTELHNRMDRKMAINDAVNGQIKSNVSSLAMLYYFSPLLDRIGLKRVYWDSAFKKLNEAILRYKFTTGNFKNSPVYSPIMVVDQQSKIENTVLLLQNRLITHREAIDSLRGGENSVQVFEEIKKEFKELSEIDGFLDIKKTDPGIVL